MLITRIALSIGLVLAMAASIEAGHGRPPKPVQTARPATRPVVPPFPQYYIKAHDGSAIPVVPVFVVPVAPPLAPGPGAKPACYRFFCD